jgi:hypothetical protein
MLSAGSALGVVLCFATLRYITQEEASALAIRVFSVQLTQLEEAVMRVPEPIPQQGRTHRLGGWSELDSNHE